MTAAPGSTSFTPATAAELGRYVADNAAGPRLPLYPVGGRTALGFGYAPSAPGVEILTGDLNRVIDYPARDMTITVEAGVRCEDLAARLAAEGQRLAVDIPQAHRATVGGALATNTSGPRRYGCGTLRDTVIGLSAIDGRGRSFKSGGRVVKNVAGYDLCKLLVGSLGTLAIVTQVTFKLRPLPERSLLLWVAFETFAEVENVLERLLRSDARPVALEVLNREAARQIATEARQTLPVGDAVLCVGVEGTSRETAWQLDQLRREIVPFYPQELCAIDDDNHARAVWQALTEFGCESEEPLTFQANLLPSRTMEFLRFATELGAVVLAHAGNGIVVGHVAEETVAIGDAERILSQLRAQARRTRGNVIVLHAEPDWVGKLPVFGEPESAWPLMRQIKAQLDPFHVLNPGRFLDRAQEAAATP